MLDGLIIMTAVVTFSWYFILGPTMLQGYETNLAKFVGSAYPCFDLILIFCMLLLWFRSSDPPLLPAVRLLLIGLIVIVITDSFYDYTDIAERLRQWTGGYRMAGGIYAPGISSSAH